MDSEVTVYRAPRSNLPKLSSLKHLVGLVGFISTVIGTLLALGLIHPFGGTEDALAAAAGKTAEAGSASFTFEVEAPFGGDTVTLKGDGGYDFRRGRGRVAYSLPPELAAAFGSATAKAVIDGDATYMYLPQWSPERPWIRLGAEAPGESSQAELDVFTELVPDDPSQILQFLEAGGDVEEVGEESLFGTETTHYQATVDLEKLVEHAPVDLQNKVRAAADGLGADTLTVDAWIDGNDFVRRLAMEGEFAGVGDVAMTVDLYDFGTEVDVKVPRPSQVLDGALLGL